MKYVTSFILVLYNIACISCETAPKYTNVVNTDSISKEFGDVYNRSLERLQRSPLPYDYISPPPFSPSVHPYDQLSICPWDHLHPQYTPVECSFNPECPHQRPFVQTHFDLDYLNNPVESVPAAATHDPPELLSPEGLIIEPESQLESPVYTQTQESMLMSQDQVPPTLHWSPHDVFPFSDQSVHTLSQVNPAKLHQEEPHLIFEEPAGHCQAETYNRVLPHVVLPEEHPHHQESCIHPQKEQYPEALFVNGNLDGFCEGASKQSLQSPSIDNRKKITFYDDKNFSRRTTDNCCMVTKRFGLSKISHMADGKCSVEICSVNDQSKVCSNESQMEENCGKTKTKHFEYDFPIFKIRKETVNRNTCNSCSGQSEVTRATQHNDRDQSLCEIRQILSKEQFDELKTILRNVVQNSNLKNRGSTQDLQENLPHKRLTCTDCYSCSCKCINKLRRCLHLAKDVGDYIADNAQRALQGIGGFVADELKHCHIDLREASS